MFVLGPDSRFSIPEMWDYFDTLHPALPRGGQTTDEPRRIVSLLPRVAATPGKRRTCGTLVRDVIFTSFNGRWAELAAVAWPAGAPPSLGTAVSWQQLGAGTVTSHGWAIEKAGSAGTVNDSV